MMQVILPEFVDYPQHLHALLAGGGRLQVAQFLDPGEYLNTGIRVMALLYSKMSTSLA